MVFHYLCAAKCGMLAEIVDTSVPVSNDRQPALQGSTMNFSCPTGLVLTGPNATTCMENGEWEPDPTSLKCESFEGAVEYYSGYYHYCYSVELHINRGYYYRLHIKL